MIVGVLVQLASKNVDKIFDYHVPFALEEKIKVGIRVEVPFGRQRLEGFILEKKLQSNTEKELKDVIDVVDEDIVLNDELLELGKKMKELTLSSLISCYQVMLPKALKAKKGTYVGKKYEVYYRLKTVGGEKFSPKQQEIIDSFSNGEKKRRKELVSISSSAFVKLQKMGVLVEEKVEKYRLQYLSNPGPKKELTEEQQKVVDIVLQAKDVKNYLLWGVTGSGKTEVYMELIEDVLKKGKTSILLVPEISLTPQMVERFTNRFGQQIAAIHSALSEGEKYDEWRRIYRGEARIVIGARSAIFAPLQNLGMIIIDEEHSDSYKQEDCAPRYRVIDIALLRAKNHQASVILGSATPSLDAFARCQKGIYQLLRLPHRVSGRSLPNVEIIDMNQEIRKSFGHFSQPLIAKIGEKLQKQEQVILLLNRRGYSSFVSCKNCGYTIKCPNCDISLTYHKSSSVLRCHYCGYAEKLLDVCPQCREKSLTTLGVGTEKIEEELHQLFPFEKVLRMDIDTTSKKGMYKKMFDAFQKQEYSILLGTQMVAKGLDFSNVTLVGVINADTSLNIPDFRSSENTFDLLSQVSGRSGRSEKKGEVILQTFNPNHYAISYVKNHDYFGFYQQEMKIRKKLKYPPFYYLVYIKISGRDYNLVEVEAKKIKLSLERYLKNTIILGPSPAFVFKVKQIYHYGIILKFKQEQNLVMALQKMDDHYRDSKKIKVDIDFHPIHF